MLLVQCDEVTAVAYSSDARNGYKIMWNACYNLNIVFEFEV